MIAEEGKKPCGRCGEAKPLDQFHKSRAKSSGYESYCKACKMTPEERERHNGRTRRHKFVMRYGITLEQRDEMAEAQGQRCVICQEVKQLHVDHCHDTGKVRGLICHSCNVMLGVANDNPSILRAGIEYLERSRQ
jgi:hypothetical protein